VRKAARALVLALLALSGCDDPKTAQRDQAPAQATGRPGEAARALEERLRARLGAGGPLTQRAVQLHRQALTDTLVICGQVNPSGRSEDAFLPYVAIAAFDGERLARLDLFLAATPPEATRVYFEMVDRCWEGGGPTSPRGSLRPLPPAPAGLIRNPEGEPAPALPRPGATSAAQPPDSPSSGQATAPPAAASATPVALPPAAPGARASIMVTQRTPANIRSEPSGAGSILRVAPRGAMLQIHGEAPGGWVLVGESEPWGWVHSSLLEGR
jgi:hypothetical protein